MSGSSLLWFGGMALLFAGERLFPDGSMRIPLSGGGVVLALVASILRFLAAGREADPARKRAQHGALLAQLVGLLAVALYATTLRSFTDLLGFDEDAASRWYGSVTSLWAILWLLGAAPSFFLDRALVNEPRVLPPAAARRAAQAGIATALAVALVFPVNYLAANHKWEADYAYFRTTRPGSSTLALVRNLKDPIAVTLFFAPGSDVKEQALPYFEALAEASAGKLSVTVTDQALDPKLAESLKINDNGYIALTQGEGEDAVTEKFKVGTELDKARRELKKLDETAQKHLLKLAKGKRTAYILVGHGEGSARERDNPTRKINELKKELQDQNFKVENFGATSGSTDAVPDDAALLVIPGPSTPLLPEEVDAIDAYAKRGGALMILAEPLPPSEWVDGKQPLDDLLARLSLKAGPHLLVHAQQFYRQRRGIADRVLLVTNRYGSHESVRELSRNSDRVAVFVPTAMGVEKIEGAPEVGKVTAILRSFPDTWADVNGNLQHDPDEPGKIFDIAVAVEGPEVEGKKGFRALVFGDLTGFSDGVMGLSAGNRQLAADGFRWLVGDEALAGDTQSEEDVKIQHTRDEDIWWFWGTIFFVPAAILIAGLLIVRVRRKS